MAMRTMVALFACVVVAGCAAPPPNGQNRTVPGGAFSVTLPFKLSEPAQFRYGGATLDANSFVAAVKQDVDGQMAQVVSQDAVGRSIRIQVPTAEKSAVVSTLPPRDWERAGRHAAEFARLTDGARAEAVRRGGLFERIEIEAVDKADPAATGTEYLLYKSGPDWVLKHFAGRSERLSAGVTLAEFVASVRRAVGAVRRPTDHLATRFLRNPDRLVFGFNGEDYTDISVLTGALQAYHEADSNRARPLPVGLGGRALVIVANIPTTKPMFPSAELNADLVRGFAAYVEAVNAATVAVIKRSALFDEVVVEHGGIEDPTRDGFDWVLWQKPGQGLIWYARAKAGAPVRLSLTGDAETLGAELVGQLGKIKG